MHTGFSFRLAIVSVTLALCAADANVIEYDIGTQNKPNAAYAPWHLHVWAPSSPSPAPARVMFFAPGFAGFMASTDYSEILSTVAANTNTVVVGIDRKLKLAHGLVVNYTDLAYTAGKVIEEYIENDEGLLKDCKSHGFSGTINTKSDFVFAAHSAGNHLSVRRMVNWGCQKFTSMVMIDPVDGEDPEGIIKEYVIHPPAPVNFTIPALHIMTGKDPQGHPSCAPAFMANARFYNAWTGPIWQINATLFGHMGVVDADRGGLFKLACPKNKNATARGVYRSTVAESMTKFINGLYNGDVGMLNSLTQPQTFPFPVVLQQKNMNVTGGALGKGGKPQPFCRR